jgi:hypothetical protein
MNWQGSKPCSKRIGPGFPGPVRFAFGVSGCGTETPFFARGSFLCMGLFSRFCVRRQEKKGFPVGTSAALANYRP